MARSRSPHDVKQLAEAKLASSTLTLADAKLLGIEVHASAQLLDPAWPAVPCLRFVYHDADGKPRKDGVCRVRVLAQPVGAFGQVDAKLRYLQPKGTPPGVYLPRLPTLDWRALLADPAQPLLITEGELKSAAACKAGFPSLGLGGVWSWRSAKRGFGLLPELDGAAWEGRTVTIVFDSDAATNPDVAQATAALTRALDQRGAFAKVAQLPAGPAREKVGLDDLLFQRGDQGPAILEDLINAARSDELARALWSFNDRFAFVLSPPMVYDEELETPHKPGDFQHSAFANVVAYEQTGGDEDGEAQLKERRVAEAWVKWPLRRQVNRLTYAPGEERVVDGCLNVWPGWGVEPAASDVKLWAQLLDHLFTDAPPEVRRWFEAWCLYPLAHPGAKLPTACALWSKTQGVGKSVIGKLLGRVYGENYSEVSQRELESNFNGWEANKQFVMFDDVSAYDSRAKADILKKKITEERVLVNIKGIPTYFLPAHANYYLTSNKPNAIFLEDDDRRYFVHEVRAAPMPHDFWARFYPWMGGCQGYPDLGPGPAALLAHAARYDFKGFAPHEPPPMTAAKAEMCIAGKGELEAWLAELREDPGAKLRMGQVVFTRDLWSPAELVGLFNQNRQGQAVAASTMGLRLREAGFPPAAGGQPLRCDGVGARYYVVRNAERWTTATRKQLEQHLAEAKGGERGTRF